MSSQKIEAQGQLSPADQQILEGYKSIVEAIGLILGSSCEVVLHSLADLSSSVICIHNGAKTGRSLGSPVTDKALSILKDCERRGISNSGLYFTKTADGRTMRSSTTIIKGLEGQPIGLICINFDISTPLNEWAEILLKGTGQCENDAEHFAANLDDLLLNKVRKVQQEVVSDKSIPPRREIKEIILRLDEAGVFKLRRSVSRVASLLHVSRDVIYMHLRRHRLT